jgi:hypothetical protein
VQTANLQRQEDRKKAWRKKHCVSSLRRRRRRRRSLVNKCPHTVPQCEV